MDYVKGGGGSGDVTVAYVRNLCDGSLRRLQKAMELGLISRNTLTEDARQVLQWMQRLE